MRSLSHSVQMTKYPRSTDDTIFRCRWAFITFNVRITNDTIYWIQFALQAMDIIVLKWNDYVEESTVIFFLVNGWVEFFAVLLLIVRISLNLIDDSFLTRKRCMQTCWLYSWHCLLNHLCGPTCDKQPHRRIYFQFRLPLSVKLALFLL